MLKTTHICCITRGVCGERNLAETRKNYLPTKNIFYRENKKEVNNQ